VDFPRGFRSAATNVGVRDDTLDFTLVVADRPCAAAAVFTTSSFAGPCVLHGREQVADGRLQALVVVSKNANVATGEEGLADSRELAAEAARLTGVAADDVLVSATGLIGPRLPMDRLRAALPGLAAGLAPDRLDETARAIMTTDRRPKIASARVGDAVVLGIAKGAGMIEPDMATLLVYFFTDAELSAAELDPLLRRVVDRSFNCVTVDADMSTSDTVAVFANGLAGPVDARAFEDAFTRAAVDLAKAVAREAEGATRLLEVVVTGAPSDDDARTVGRSIAGSFLVKAAVFGADPNWGRVAMAIGKSRVAGVDPARTTIALGEYEVYRGRPLPVSEERLVEDVMRQDEVRCAVDLGLGDGTATVWGCDVSYETVRSNSEYAT
jgi:glutamate N-acetyltransferase/amino-acid N-acetyltransferase